MTASLHDRLLKVEEQFLFSVNEGKPALAAFDSMWSSLSIDLDQAVQTKAIDDETFILGNSVALKVATLSEYLLEFQSSVDAMSLSLQDSLESIFARVDIADTPRPNSTSPHSSPRSRDLSSRLPSASFETACPAYIAPAYSWLLQNLHNPYPTKTLRDTISSETGSSRAAIDTWFIDTRKRIGWNALRRKDFSNKRAEIVDSASQFFLNIDPGRSLDPPIAVAFATIEANARGLYTEKFTESTLAMKLDVAVKDLTPTMISQAKTDERLRKQQENQARVQPKRLAQAALSYPSPHHSPKDNTEPIYPSDNTDLFNIPLISCASRKRSSAQLDVTESDSEWSCVRQNKRSRINLDLDPEAQARSLPSPAPSFDAGIPSVDSVGFANPSDVFTVPLNRKRRLSDADSHTPKRPRNVLSGTRPNVVSDPLPCSSTLSTWFESQFGTHTPISIDESDFLSPFDVELYDYSDIIRDINPSLTEASNDLISPQGSPPPFFGAHHSIPETQFSASNTPVNNLDYYGLPDPEVSTSEALAHNISGRSELSILKSHPINFSNDTLANGLGIGVNLSAITPHTLGSGYDWMSLLFSSPPTPTFHFSGDSPSTTDLGCTLDIPCGTVSVPWSSLESEKAVKQRKLIEMKEATRRLEAEIAAS